jgi:hypothetical protein
MHARRADTEVVQHGDALCVHSASCQFCAVAISPCHKSSCVPQYNALHPAMHMCAALYALGFRMHHMATS